jgi:hypothetical protein
VGHQLVIAGDKAVFVFFLEYGRELVEGDLLALSWMISLSCASLTSSI